MTTIIIKSRQGGEMICQLEQLANLINNNKVNVSVLSSHPNCRLLDIFNENEKLFNWFLSLINEDKKDVICGLVKDRAKKYEKKSILKS
jgi:hypothetical protein